MGDARQFILHHRREKSHHLLFVGPPPAAVPFYCMAFVDRHVGESLAQDLSPDEQVDALAQLHTEFVGYTVHMIHEQDSSIFHVVLRQDLAEVVLTVETDPDAPDHVTCVHVEFP